uniref:Right handed beta helix domain-containing protein n=1 Tax=Amphimedon queenslandica TaxID=400682 RepID=A0A1X7VRG1_AMPQE
MMGLSHSVVILFLLLCHFSSNTVIGIEYYIHSPTSPQSCPQNNEECDSLSHYIGSNTDRYFVPDTTFVFLPGVHPLNEVMMIENLHSLTLTGENATIHCNEAVGMSFTNVTLLTLHGITLTRCGMNIGPNDFNDSVSVYGKTMFNFSVGINVALFINYASDVMLSEVTISQSFGYGLIAVNMLGDSTITRSHFDRNNHYSLDNSSCYTNISLYCKGGNAILIYTDLLECPSTPLQYSLTINDSIFEGGVDAGLIFQPFTLAIKRNDVELIGGAGLGLLLMQSSYGLDANITNINATANAAFVGANVYINVWDYVDNSTITITDSNMTSGNAYNRFRDILEVAGSYTMAPGFFYLNGMISLEPVRYEPVCVPISKYVTDVFLVQDIEVSFNEASLNSGGFMYMWPRSFMDVPRHITMRRAKAEGNNGDATFINIYGGLPRYGYKFKVFIEDCYFARNFYRKSGNGLETSSPQVHLINSVQHIEFTDCQWINNSVSGVRPLQSILFFRGTNEFIGNNATNGGGLNVEEGTIVYLGSNSTTIFKNNYVEQYGGAIYAQLVSYMCFFQIEGDQFYPRVYFDNNYAKLAGDAVYANLKNCILQNGIYASDALELFTNVISNFSETDLSSTSLISAPASQFCFCDEVGSRECSENNYETNGVVPISAYPGQAFTIKVQALAYSQFFSPQYSSLDGLTPTIVTASIVNDTGAANLGQSKVQNIGIGCSELTYTVNSLDRVTQVILSPQNRRIYEPIVLNVTMSTCPVGFVLSVDRLKCVCVSLLRDRNIECNTAKNTISKPSSLWIGIVNASDDADHTSNVAVATPFAANYLSDVNFVNFSLSDPDVQCMYNHAGVLCGGCQINYSAVLGSSECRKCSNTYLLLLVFFAVIAFALIGFISLLRLTVSTGRINGLLFYANVIKLANFDFFEFQSPMFAFFQILVDWTNLDFSFRTCFYDGFDLYAKAWFQYIFPFYLFVILAAAMIGAHYSTKISKIVPKNIVAVSTTIALMTFTKLLRASAEPIAYASIRHVNVDGSSQTVSTYQVWSIDGNVKYFSLKHALLFLFSLGVLLGIVVPFAIIMFFYPFIWSFTAHEGTAFERFVCFIRRRLFKMKPLLETYDGPYHPNFRFWTGLLLLLRFGIILLALASPVVRTTGVTAISIILLGGVLAKRIYNNLINRRVEFLYLLNLAALQFTLLVLNFTEASDDAQGYAVSASILLAYLTFAFTTLNENWTHVIKPRFNKLRGRSFVEVPENDYAELRKEELKNMEANFDEETVKTNAFIDVVDARTKVTRSVFSVEEKIEQLNEGLLKSNNTI